jgi:chorismate synthase
MNDMELLARYLVQQQIRPVDHQQMHRYANRVERGGLRRSARLIAQQIWASRRHAG